LKTNAVCTGNPPMEREKNFESKYNDEKRKVFEQSKGVSKMGDILNNIAKGKKNESMDDGVKAPRTSLPITNTSLNTYSG